MHIRKLTNQDQERIRDYVSEEVELNFFMIGDMESFGLEGNQVSMWAGETDEGWEWVLCLFLENSVIFYSQKADYEMESLLDFLKELDGRNKLTCISGKLELIERLALGFPQYAVQPTHMCRCNSLKNLPKKAPKGVELRCLKEEEARDMISLYLEIEEFRKTYEGREEEGIEGQLENFRSGSMAVGVFEDGKLLSVAATSAACRTGAMVVGVATREGFRGNGYASAAVAELCRRTLENGSGFLCLFYSNPEAGRIYHRMGFETVGDYAMLR